MLRNALDASLHARPSSRTCVRLCASQALDALARWKGGAACKAQGWMPACPSWPAGSSPAHVNPGASRGCGATLGLILSGESGSLARCCAEGGAKCFAIRMTPHPLGASNVPTEALIGGAERIWQCASREHAAPLSVVKLSYAPVHRYLRQSSRTVGRCASKCTLLSDPGKRQRESLDASRHSPPARGECLRLCASPVLDARPRRRGGAACMARVWMPACPSWRASRSSVWINPGPGWVRSTALGRCLFGQS